MSNSFSYLKGEGESLTNSEWAQEVRARLDDLNELLEEAGKRDIIVTGTVAMFGGLYCGGDNHMKPLPTVDLTISERI